MKSKNLFDVHLYFLVRYGLDDINNKKIFNTEVKVQEMQLILDMRKSLDLECESEEHLISSIDKINTVSVYKKLLNTNIIKLNKDLFNLKY